jgi:hypothetical protein
LEGSPSVKELESGIFEVSNPELFGDKLFRTNFYNFEPELTSLISEEFSKVLEKQ